MRKKIAIVGLGPRGLSALEHLCKALSEKSVSTLPKIHLFEKEKVPGAGQVWRTNQTDINRLNISQRALSELKGRLEMTVASIHIPSFPSYTNWLPKEKQLQTAYEPDLFPPRPLMGEYLKKRFESITKSLSSCEEFKIIEANILKVSYQDEKFSLHEENIVFGQYDEVTLTIGHQPTELSQQLKQWKKHETKIESAQLFTAPYPTKQVVKNSKINKSTHVAIRGFGLATIDVIRALTTGRGGEFKLSDKKTFESHFQTSKDVPGSIIPFSLDGKPMIPKPLNAFIDEWFTPREKELENFESRICPYTRRGKSTNTIHFLTSAVAEIAASLYQRLGNKAIHFFEHKETILQTVNAWLQNMELQHPALYNTQDTATTLEDYCHMAAGSRKITLDYCVGQVWRHCQPTMYRLFSHSTLDVELMAAVVDLDERMKRYAYGPPLESIQQLLALHRAGILSFNYINNPNINLIDSGWQLSEKDTSINCDFMINSVLDSPTLLDVSTPLIRNLLTDDLLQPVHSEFGIKTKPNGLIVPDHGREKEIPLAVLGRLCQGSVLGVDAILECFRLRIDKWAEGVVERI